ncbi:MAG: TlpA family protein disulfide reductase [Arcobacter sp.]|nr:TlpA family protein disulfide reductase [Arcobacter sp.]
MKKFLIPIVLCFFILACFDGREEKVTSVQNNKLVFKLQRAKENFDISLKNNNKYLVLNFFTSECGACKEEIPSFIEITNDLKDKVKIVGIMGDKLSPKDSKAFINKYKFNYDVITNPRTVKILSNAVGGVFGVPVTYIYNKKGKLVNKVLGYVPKNTLLKMLRN